MDEAKGKKKATPDPLTRGWTAGDGHGPGGKIREVHTMYGYGVQYIFIVIVPFFVILQAR